MKTKKQKMYQQIEKHGQQLNDIFNTDYDNVTLCKKLFRLENKAHSLATDYCNGTATEDYFNIFSADILEKVKKIINVPEASYFPVIFNSDPRGYTLKLDDEWIIDEEISIHRDMGGYGILAPDFNN